MQLRQQFCDTKPKRNVQTGVVGFQKDADAVQFAEMADVIEDVLEVLFVLLDAASVADARRVDYADIVRLLGEDVRLRQLRRRLSLVEILVNVGARGDFRLAVIVVDDTERAWDGCDDQVAGKRFVERGERQVVGESVDPRRLPDARLTEEEDVQTAPSALLV